ncbi:9399_t:CDS:2, partial [Cetraspora pellucida]
NDQQVKDFQLEVQDENQQNNNVIASSNYLYIENASISNDEISSNEISDDEVSEVSDEVSEVSDEVSEVSDKTSTTKKEKQLQTQ